MSERKSIITDKPVAYQTPPEEIDPKVSWRVRDFEELIYAQGYDVYIDRALRCPCVEKAGGQPLSTCRNCLGRGWFFVDRRETRIIAQHMDNKKRYEAWGEVNLGTASFTSRGSDKLGFMDRIILLPLEGYFSEILRPMMFEGELVSYPIYEPLEVTNIFLYVGDYTKLQPLPPELYEVEGKKIVFDQSILSEVDEPTISIRYTHNPVFHVIDANRELMKVRERSCSFNEERLKQMPINVVARKAHYLFNATKYGAEAFENTVNTEE